MGHAAHDDQRVDAFAARIEGGVGRARLVEGVGGETPALDLVAALRRALGPARRCRIGLARLLPFAGAGPVRGDAVGQRRACRQVQGDPPVQQLGDRQRHRGARGLEDQVVGEAAVAQHLRRLQLAPGLGDVERMRLEHRDRELGAELRAGQRGDASQAQRLARQLAEPALDQCADRHRLRQAAAALDRRRAAREHQVLQRLEREHRIAAGMAQQRRRQMLRAQLGQADRLHQGGELRQVERLQHAGLQAGRFLERGTQQRAAGTRLGRTLGEAPVQRGERLRLRQHLQELDAGVVGEVQVVDHQRLQALGDRIDQGGVDGALQQQPLRLAGQGHRLAELGQHQRQRLVACRRDRERMRGQHRPQQARQHGVGDAGIARPRLDDDDARPADAEVLQQPALADAGLADQHEGAPVRPGMLERLQLAARGRSGAAAAAGWPVPSSAAPAARRRRARSSPAARSSRPRAGVPSSSFRRCSKRSKAAIAAARSPRR